MRNLRVALNQGRLGSLAALFILQCLFVCLELIVKRLTKMSFSLQAMACRLLTKGNARNIYLWFPG